MSNIQYKFKYIMAFRHRQKKTLRRKRRFLKRKSAKTYRRLPTKRRSMRGGVYTKWNVNVKYMDYASDDDYSVAVEKIAPGTFEFLSIPHDNDHKVKVGKLTLTNKLGKNYVNDRAWKPALENSNTFIPYQDGVDVYIGQTDFWSSTKQGDKKILSFEKIQQNPTKDTGTPHFPSSAPKTVWPVDVFLQIPGEDRRKEDENEQDYNERVKHLKLDSVPGYVFMFDPAQHQDGIEIEEIKGKLVIKDSDPTHKSNIVFKVIDGNYYPPAFYSFLILDSEGNRRGIVSHFRKTD